MQRFHNCVSYASLIMAVATIVTLIRGQQAAFWWSWGIMMTLTIINAILLHRSRRRAYREYYEALHNGGRQDGAGVRPREQDDDPRPGQSGEHGHVHEGD